MKLLYALLCCISWTSAIPLHIPLQKPLLSGAQLDWANSDCFPSISDNRNSTICIQQVRDPVFDNDILGAPLVDQFCGYITLSSDPNPVQLFFWVVLSEADPAKDPVVLWMNGGPGSTSLYGLFDQWGPRLIDHTQRPSVVFKNNPFRLTEKLTWVFLEQPSGTGYSTGGHDVVDSKTAAQDISTFINALFDKNTKFRFKGTQLTLAGRDFHIAGESFAGHWIPAVGSYMVKTKQHEKVKLKSFLLGNGITDAALMGDAMNKLVCGPAPPLTLIGSTPQTTKARCDNMPIWKPICDAAIGECRKDPTLCIGAYMACRQSWGDGWSDQFQRNIYDATKSKADQKADNKFFEFDFARFMNDAARRTRLGVKAVPAWQPGNAALLRRFVESGDWFRNFIPEIQDILNANIDFLLFAGDQDLACPFTLVKDTALHTDWNEVDIPGTGTKKDKFRKCEARGENTYKRIGNPLPAAYGNYIRAGHLTYAKVFGAGHMISINRPGEAKHLLESWILNRALFQECDP